MDNEGENIQVKKIELEIIIPKWHKTEIESCIDVFKTMVSHSFSMLSNYEFDIKTYILELSENDTNTVQRNHICHLLITYQIACLPCCICIVPKVPFGLNEANTKNITALYYIESEQYKLLLSKKNVYNNKNFSANDQNNNRNNSASYNETITDPIHIGIDEMVSKAIKKYEEFNLLEAATMYV